MFIVGTERAVNYSDLNIPQKEGQFGKISYGRRGHLKAIGKVLLYSLGTVIDPVVPNCRSIFRIKKTYMMCSLNSKETSDIARRPALFATEMEYNINETAAV